jgi:GDP-4-dehydro-6-deoxy-D-mannose reductase
VTGFVGGHLLDALTQRDGFEVWGLSRDASRAPAAVARRCRLLGARLDDRRALERALDQVRPDAIVHLAGQSSVHRSWEDPEGTFQANVGGLLHLLEGLHRRSLAPRVLVVGSADEYGAVALEQLPVREDAPLRPSSPYAVSRVACSYLALQHHLAHALPVVRTRTFPHTGPGRDARFAEASFARQLAEIEAGQREPVLHVGNLEAVRDFTDVRDVVEAYLALLEHGEPGEVYNVCSGVGLPIREVLERLMALASVRVEVKVDAARLRPADVPALVGDPGRLREATGWAPKRSLDSTLADLLEEWRDRVRSRAVARHP